MCILLSDRIPGNLLSWRMTFYEILISAVSRCEEADLQGWRTEISLRDTRDDLIAIEGQLGGSKDFLQLNTLVNAGRIVQLISG